LLNLVKSC